MTKRHFRFAIFGCLASLVIFSIFLVWLIQERSLREQDGIVMTELEQLGHGYWHYAGMDENDSTWIDKRLDQWYGNRIRTVRWKNANIEDLELLTQINKLQELFITNSKIADLSPLAEIDSLRLVVLTGTEVTDLTPLQTLPKLKYLNLHQTPLTSEQVNDFANANPDCKIFFDPAQLP